MSRSYARPAPHLRLTKVYRRPDILTISVSNCWNVTGWPRWMIAVKRQNGWVIRRPGAVRWRRKKRFTLRGKCAAAIFVGRFSSGLPINAPVGFLLGELENYQT
jgi:hypothetical protein